MDAIDRLSKDPVNAVRFMIAEKLLCLFYTKPDDMWRHIETMATGDQSNAVLVALINRLPGVRRPDADCLRRSGL
jgi:hypothetical protein